MPPDIPADRDVRIMRIAATAEHINVVIQLLAGALLAFLLDAKYYQDIRAGDLFDPPWLSFAIPINLTAIWLTVATWSVRHLWRVVAGAAGMEGMGEAPAPAARPQRDVASESVALAADNACVNAWAYTCAAPCASSSAG